MWPLEPGPFIAEALPLGPPVVAPGTFLALAGPLVPALDGGVVRADGLTADLAPHANTDIDPTFGAAIDTAIVGLGALDQIGDGYEFAGFGSTLDTIDEHSTRQRAETPAPADPEPDLGIDASIEPEPPPSSEENTGWQDQFGDDVQQP